MTKSTARPPRFRSSLFFNSASRNTPTPTTMPTVGK
jgi:hypothetical protein